MCGSCPHLFFIQNGELKYQGEIFDVKPNLIQKEKIKIPNSVTELIIAELEQETTIINYINKNGFQLDSEIILKEGDNYSILVSTNDIIELEGKYVLNEYSDKSLSITKKYNLIKKYKNNWWQQCV
jgi:tRNA A22 N-methylase